MAGQLPVWPAGAESPQGGNQEAGQKAQGAQWVYQGLDERGGGLACAFIMHPELIAVGVAT